MKPKCGLHTRWPDDALERWNAAKLDIECPNSIGELPPSGGGEMQ